MVERRMRAQYSALDTTMAKANALSKYVQQQFYTKSVYDQDKD
jgi:flagellar capping protein FliD